MTSQRMGRRQFVRSMVASGIGAAGAVGVVAALRASGAVGIALASTTAGAGASPYGPLQRADTNGIMLPAGFTSRLLATSGDRVAGTTFVWHSAPDGGTCFPSADGGWVYVSNSEVDGGNGGVSVLRFDADGTIAGAYRILTGTNRNCAGGRTVAGTWLSCEENGTIGQVYECDPQVAGQGVLRAGLGSFNHEAAVEDPIGRAVYLTEDDPAGRLYRFVPDVAGDLSEGRLFAASVAADGKVTWRPTTSSAPDRRANTTVFNGGEGLWIEDRILYVTTKGDRRVWTLDLDAQVIDLFYDAAVTPGAALNAVDNCTVHSPSADVFVCEDGGNMEVCLITTDSPTTVVAPFVRIIGHATSEWTGVAFSPDHRRMYLSSQRGDDGRGRTYEIAGPFRGSAPMPVATTLVEAGRAWKYLDRGRTPADAWRTAAFDDSSWATGTAPLGYGDPVATPVAARLDPEDRPITTYFRRVVSVPGTHPVTDLVLRLRRDDGAVVHLDGVELARSKRSHRARGPSRA